MDLPNIGLRVTGGFSVVSGAVARAGPSDGGDRAVHVVKIEGEGSKRTS
jgi:hypothetical protein